MKREIDPNPKENDRPVAWDNVLMRRQRFFRLWSGLGFLGDALLMLNGGLSSNLFLAWAGIAGLIGQLLITWLAEGHKLLTSSILLSTGVAMILAGVNALGQTGSVHMGYIWTGGFMSIAFILLFFVRAIGPFAGPALAAGLFACATISLLDDGLANHNTFIIVVSLCYGSSNVCCLLIQPPRRLAGKSANEA